MTIMRSDPDSSVALPSMGIAPLVGNLQSEEANWLGASLARLLAEGLDAAGVPVPAEGEITRSLRESGLSLPLDPAGISRLKNALALKTLIHGRYTLDSQGKMLGLSLFVDSPGTSQAPLEAAAPLSSFDRFIERLTLALMDRTGISITEPIRAELKDLPRPANFEAFRQMALARMNWAKGQNELALTAIESALALDPDYEEAYAVQVAVSREAGDKAATAHAFSRWAALAARRGQGGLAAERLALSGHWLTEQGAWDEARAHYQEAGDSFRRLGDVVSETRMQNNIANLEMLRGRHQQAIKVYRRTLRDFEMNPDTRQDTALSYYNLSLAHKHIGQTEEALKAVEQALRLARALNDSHLLAYFTAQRGAVLDDLGEWSRATEDYLNAARLLDTVGDDPGRATIMSHQAALHKRQGAYERAEKLLLNALSIFDKARLPHIHDQALIWLNLGDLYFAMDHLQDAWDYANRALETFERLGSAWKDQAREIVSLIDQALPPEADTQSAENIQGAPSDRDSAPSPGSLFRPEAGQSPPAASPGFDPLDGGEIPPSSLS